jgi:hypothetical protein
MADSPFSTILEPYQAQLPHCLREQYLMSSDAPYELVLGGKMQRTWHRPFWLWPIFWLLAQGNVLFPEIGKNVPTILSIRGERTTQGDPIQTWERIFHFSKSLRRRYQSTMVYDNKTGNIMELQGPGNAFVETAELRFTPPQTIEFITVKSHLQIGRWQLPLPSRFWITAHVIQQADSLREDTSSVQLTITHNLLGPIFGYEGIFRTRRRNIKNNRSCNL